MNTQYKSVGGYSSVPAGWDVVPLAQVAFFQEGPGLRKWQWTDSGMKVINVTNILGDGQIDTANTRRFISMEEFSKTYSHFSVDDGDIVIASSGNTYGKTGRISAKDLPLMMNTSVIRFHSGNAQLLNDDFLYAFLRSEVFRNQVESFVTGSAQPNFGPSHLKQMVIPLPPLSIQRQIAGILSAYDELIENNQRRIRILEDMARSLYREWFVHFRYPGHESISLVDSSLGPIPQGWEVTTLRAVTTKIGSGATPRGGKDAYKSEGIHLIRSQNIYDYNFEFNGLAFIDEQQAAELDNVTVEENDILLNITGASVARCALVPSYLLPARVNQHVAIVRAAPAKVSPFYILDAINSVQRKQQLLTLAQGGATREALTKDTVSNFEIVLPPRSLMKRYDSIARGIHEQREVLLRQIQNLRRTRDLLLPRLLSGTVRLSPEEVA